MEILEKLQRAADKAEQLGKKTPSLKQLQFLSRLIDKADEDFNQETLESWEASKLIDGYLAANGQVKKHRDYNPETDLEGYIQSTLRAAGDAIIAAINANAGRPIGGAQARPGAESRSAKGVSIEQDDIPF